jgi:hypothetical protein
MLVGMSAFALNAGTANASAGAPDSARALSAAHGATQKVIVLLKDQPAVVAKNSPAFATRQSQVKKAQASVAGQLRATSKNVHSYSLVNALSATVSSAEAASLAGNSSVAAVIPDEVIHGPAANTSDDAAAAPAAGAPPRTPPPNTCPAPGGKPLLEPEALQVTNTDSDNPAQKTARSLGFTGAGVKVAYMAEGIDINNPDFIRADGSHVFSDYQDFTGDGVNAPTSAGEAFLDASAIAAQGRQTYDVSHFSADPLNTPCDIRIEGVAPGVSLVGLKVFGQDNATTTSGFLQAIDYAVTVAKVDVLNESFGGNPFPDNATADAVSLMDDAAVKAGVTVTASSGDAGPTNTIGSPSTNPNVISVGGSTTFRWLAQTGYGGYYPLASKGWLNDNVTPLSSSGFSQSGRTIDLLAPGDSSFALCTPNLAMYADCASLAGNPSPVERSGGTSESAPLTAGAAALVIQAYRQTHGGASPTPALVKQLLVNTSDDLGHPGDQQGAGRLDSYQAVLAAMSVHDSNGTPAATGDTVLTSQTQLDASGLAGSAQSWPLTLTNNGADSQKLTLGQRTLGGALDPTTGSVKLNDKTSKHFVDTQGNKVNYQLIHFTVPKGRDRLDVDLAYPGDPTASLNARVRLALVDPDGTFAAHSLPQGVGNAGHVDVRNPVGGTWTGMIWSIVSTNGGTTGKVIYKAVTHDYHATGSVTPSSVTLAPGQSRTVTVRATTPGQPGDQANSVTINAGGGHLTSVPVALRSLVNTQSGGAFSGVLTGGNGRDFNTGQTGYYQFDVAKGQRDLTANFTLGGHQTDPVFGYLVDPAGNAQANSANVKITGFDDNGQPETQPISTLSLFARAPAAGRWTVILDFAPAVSGHRLAVPFSGNVALNSVRATASGLPNNASVKLAAGTPVTVPVTVRNTGVAPEAFFIDPRRDHLSDLTLAQLAPSPFPLPLKPTSFEPEWNVPTETTQVNIGVTANVPVNFDFGWLFGFGDPDVSGTSSGTSAVGSYSGSPVPSGAWFAIPAEIGPFGPGGAPAGVADVQATATTLAFDNAVTSPIGNFEADAVDPSAGFAVLTVNPGHSITIPVTITPRGPKGTVVRGNLFVDDLSFLTVLGSVPSGQELAGLPYQYTIG